MLFFPVRSKTCYFSELKLVGAGLQNRLLQHASFCHEKVQRVTLHRDVQKYTTLRHENRNMLLFVVQNLMN